MKLIGFLLVLIITAGCHLIMDSSDNQRSELECHEKPVEQLYHAKCYQEGQLILDMDVICPSTSSFTGKVYSFYEAASKSRISPSSGTECFVLKVAE